MQKSSLAAYDVHDIIHNSLLNLEWSHTNVRSTIQ